MIEQATVENTVTFTVLEAEESGIKVPTSRYRIRWRSKSWPINSCLFIVPLYDKMYQKILLSCFIKSIHVYLHPQPSHIPMALPSNTWMWDFSIWMCVGNKVIQITETSKHTQRCGLFTSCCSHFLMSTVLRRIFNYLDSSQLYCLRLDVLLISLGVMLKTANKIDY